MEQRQMFASKYGRRLLPDWDLAHQNEYALAIARDSGDEDAVKQILFENKRDDVRDALASNFDVSVKTGGAKDERGKLNIKKQQIHGKSGSQENINALMMAFDTEQNGPIVDPNLTAYDQYVQQAAGDVLSSQAISELAKMGLGSAGRTPVSQLSDANRIGRAMDRVPEYGRGYDEGGALIAGMPTDGGHGKNFPHAEYPEYSDARWNMGTEQGYVNKVTQDATGEAALQSIRNSLRKRMHADESGDTIRQVANSWQVGEGFPEDRAQVAQDFLTKKMAGIREDSPGDDTIKDKQLVINSGGGDVHVGAGALKGNGNGKH